LERAASSAPIPTQDGQRILFLGALNRKKAPDVFLRAAALLAPNLPGASFVIVGSETSEDRAFRATLQELASHPNLTGRLEMPGHLDPSAVIDQIRRARVVVCPSRIETFSRTTIEALALGRPVIVTETTGAAHWVQSTGCGSVILPNNPNALADAIRDWASRENVPNASHAISSELTASRAAEDWIREIRTALNAQSGNHRKK
jgi:glycosyltransferase involved in cell wall biosynthesis